MPYSTKQQRCILRCLEDRPEEAMTAGEVAEILRKTGRPVGLATVYRQLDRLEEIGRIHRVDTSEGAVYQYCGYTEPAHAGCFLLRCESCGRISHLEAEHQFHVDARRTVLTGLCSLCAGKEALHGAV